MPESPCLKGYPLLLRRLENFARSGDPNGLDADGTPMPRWTPYALKSPLMMEFLDTPGMEKTQSQMKKLLVEYNKKLHEK
jgi:hypothetical protein